MISVRIGKRVGSIFYIVMAVFLFVSTDSAFAQTQSTRDWFPGITQQRWNEIANSRRIADNSGAILRMLARLENVSRERWQAVVDPPGSLDLSQLSRAPEGYSGMPVRLEGRTSKVSRISLDQSQQASFDAERLFAVECTVTGDQSAIVICKTLPKLWQKDTAVAEPFAGYGIFLTGTVDGVPVFVSPAIEWYPDRPGTLKGVDKCLVQLAQAGMDVGLLDQVRNGSNAAFLSSEARCVASLLAAIKQLENPTMDFKTRAPFPLIEVLKEPANHLAQMYLVAGRVRRITEVQIESVPLQKSLGQKSYFHVDLFVPLQAGGISINDSQGNQISMHGSYGVTLILLNLPPGMKEASEEDGQSWKLIGCFLKTWQHKTVDSREVSRTLRRPNPIIFGVSRTAQRVNVSTESGNSLSWAITAFWLGLIGLIGGLLLWQKKRS